MNVQEYRDVVHEDIAIAANANYSNPGDEFMAFVVGVLSSGEEIDDFVECYYEGVTKKRKANMRIDGYAIDEADGSCCVFFSDYRGPHEDDAIRADDINNSFKKMRFFIDEAVNNKLYASLEESTVAYEFARKLYDELDKITKFRFYLVTDAYNKQRSKTLKDDEIAGKTIELNVWDINRIFDIVSSKAQKESIQIVLKNFGYDGIPCVKAVEYHNVVADIEVNNKVDDEETDEENESGLPDNIITYTSYLAVVPGTVLNELYYKYGSRLLEGNVRSFLSVRGKINKSIQNTIKNYPEMFFAYNNGIAATATEIETKKSDDGLLITSIKDLQIVNGGQTTASITNTLLTLKKGENVDITNLFVPMKLSVLDHSMSEKIIPKISEYSNSQNPVQASDFFSNHPFHIRMEEYSRKTPAPAVNGNQYQQYWYYERTRGQYNQGKMKFKPKSSQLKQYEIRYPSNQVIDMIQLAKYMDIYAEHPDIVSKGKQKIVETFANELKPKWSKSDLEFNPFYYKRVVALAIIFKATDNIIKEKEWYKVKHSYKANVIAYSMSLLFHEISNKHKNMELDFGRIWNQQAIFPELERQLAITCDEVYDYITRDDRGIENVTEWCKREACWKKAQDEDWTILPEFVRSLISKADLKEEVKEARETRAISNEVDDISFIISKGCDYWAQVLTWGESRRLLSDMEKSVLGLVARMETTGIVPSAKQAKVVLKAREKLISEGMPLQF